MDEKMMEKMNETFSDDYEVGIKEFAELLTFMPEEQRLIAAVGFVTNLLSF